MQLRQEAGVARLQFPSVRHHPPGGNPIEALKQTVSASRLNCWLACRLKFFFRYVQQISKPKTPALHVGSVVRHLYCELWDALQAESSM